MQLLEALPGRRGYSCQLSMTRSEVSAAAGRTAPTHSTYGGSSSAAASLLPGVYGGSAGLIAAGAARNASAAAAAGGASTTTNSSSSSTFSPCKLLVGCSDTDELLLLRSVVLERFDSPLQVRAGCWCACVGSSCLCFSKVVGLHYAAVASMHVMRKRHPHGLGCSPTTHLCDAWVDNPRAVCCLCNP